MSEAGAVAIGGGLAGAAFALELARNGIKVTVLERSRAPVPKVCGDFLSAEALDLLGYLGIDAARLGASTITTLTLATGDRAASAALPFPAAGLSRLALDEQLLRAAAEAGAEIVRGVHVTGLEPMGGETVVHTGQSGVRARFVALATGKHNLRGWPRDAGTATAFKLQMSLTAAARRDLAGRVQLVLFDGGYVGVCLVEQDLATLCWQINTGHLKRIDADWQAQIAGFRRRSAVLGDLLEDARPVQPRPAVVSGLPFGYVRRARIADAVYPIGDQIAVIPAFTGDGTSLALSSGVRAARAVLAGETAGAFQDGFAHDLGRQFRLARVVGAVFRTEATRRLAVGAVRLLPGLASHLARATRLTAASRPALGR
jgi:flavin-dependent dehydrogenase